MLAGLLHAPNALYARVHRTRVGDDLLDHAHLARRKHVPNNDISLAPVVALFFKQAAERHVSQHARVVALTTLVSK
eukprot:6175913-Pleurochrysis_carterae.AAC.2